MYQDIKPHIFHNEYTPCPPKPGDPVICYFQDRIAVKKGEKLRLPRAEEFGLKGLKFLFSIDDANYYGIAGGREAPEGCEYSGVRPLSFSGDAATIYAILCGQHIMRWYGENRLCSRCGHPLEHRRDERALFCPQCGRTVYPTVSPAVILRVLNGRKILFSQYAHGEYKHYALIAGFAEFGETIEDTCRREVMEEVGLKIKNLRYYKSQPWGLSSSLLFGFYCQLDGEDSITLDEKELSAARWFDIDNLPEECRAENGSLTREMMLNAYKYIEE